MCVYCVNKIEPSVLGLRAKILVRRIQTIKTLTNKILVVAMCYKIKEMSNVIKNNMGKEVYGGIALAMVIG